MVKETVRYALDQFENVQKIGILATNGTIQSGVYRKECEDLGVEAVVPSRKNQEEVMSLIYDDIKKGRPGDPLKFQKAYEDLMEAGSDVVRSEEHTSELQSRFDLVCRLLLEKKK